MAATTITLLDLPTAMVLSATPLQAHLVIFPIGARNFEIDFLDSTGYWYPSGTEGVAINAAAQPLPMGVLIPLAVPGTAGKAPNLSAAGRRVAIAADGASANVIVTARA